MNRRTLLAAGFTALAAPAFAQVEALPAADRRLVEQAAAYLQAMKTVKGRFTQVSSRGASSAGKIYLSRPGKARFEYDAPAQMLVVSDGRNVSIYDGRLKTFEKAPLGATPLGIFLARRIDLSQDVRVTRVLHTVDGFGIAMVDSHGQADGGLVLQFSTTPLALTGWTVLDGQGVETKVALSEVMAVDSLDPTLFVINDPRKAAG